MPWQIPLLIFLARICDVSIGTVRIITVMRGHKVVAAILGFLESVVWLLAVSGVLKFINDYPFPQNIAAIVAYGAGFGTGTLVGILIEQKLALGLQMIRVINTEPNRDLSPALRAEGLIVTELQGHGATGPVEICFSVVPRRQAQAVIDKILDYSPRAFITIEDLRRSSSALERMARSQTPAWLRLIKFK
ncbi:MAG: DUF2179 domain-containing protein [Candidatus Sumerlaeia bacterium]|nr:DUF2179 domain-containing protein [Candidatus Sumerlaeia bacterium]